MAKALEKPWEFLDSYRGKDFGGEWPTVPEMFSIRLQDFLTVLALLILMVTGKIP